MILQNGFAQLVDIETSKIVASNFFSTKQSNTSNKIKNVLTEIADNEIVFYVINFTNGGWVLVSASNSTCPILGYETTGEFSLDDEKPVQLIDLLSNYKEQINTSRHLKSANIQVSEKWNTLKKSSYLKSLKTYTPGTNLLNVTGRGEVLWGQNKNFDGGCTPSYNAFCPDKGCDDYCDNRALAGCGAVAMGQIMWYWEWPSSYNWSIMPSRLRNTTPQNHGDAVARLLSDCGKKANMTYWCSGSWTTVNKIEDAFKDFNFKGVEKRVRTDWPSNVWLQIIRNEIDCERPVFYRGDKSDLSTAKHFFVIDGYDVTNPNLFHINWGWGGTYNGNYNLDDLTPGSSNYNKNQMAVIGISPTCTGIPADITDVSYTTVSDTKSEYARNSISLPSSGKNLTVQSGGNLSLSAGSSITLNPGFSVELGGTFEAFIAPSNCSNDCGLQLMHIDNAIIKGMDDYYGWFEIRAINANSYEFVVVNRWGNVVFQGAGLLENNVTTTIWKGEGADIQGVYFGALTLRNNCGERVYKNQDITVLLGGTKSAKIDSTDNANIPKIFSEHTGADNSNSISNIVSSNDFVIYPNPNDGLFQIKTNSNCLPYSVTVVNSLGQIMYSKENITTELFQINLPKEIKGLAMTKIISNERKYFINLIIN